VNVDGVSIYHSGDLGDIRDDPSPFYKDAVDYLADEAGGIDLAFIAAFAGGRGGVTGGERYAVAKLQPSVVFPQHQLDAEYRYQRFAEVLQGEGYSGRVFAATKRGDTFYYTGR
jgi:hypothetical protein